MLELLGIAMIVYFLCFVVFWVLKSIGLMNLAERLGIENAYLAWIPFADLYVLGSLKNEIDFFGTDLANMKVILPAACGVYCVCLWIPVISYLTIIAFWVLMTKFLISFFSIYTEKAAIYGVLPGAAAILGIIPGIGNFISVFSLPLLGIFLFSIRDNLPLEQHYTPEYQ